jgi:hypothetical protein
MTNPFAVGIAAQKLRRLADRLAAWGTARRRMGRG